MTNHRFTRFPAALEARARTVRLGRGGVPSLLIHPDWERPAPTMVWMHGRTAQKELDSGRYLRWLRAGIAACSIDLPGHGERLEEEFHTREKTLDLLAQVIPEVDQVVAALAGPEWGGVFDQARLGIGGMSGGGMAALRRLCDEHPFRCAAVEATTGNLRALFAPGAGRPPASAERLADLDPMEHVAGWRPIPLLAVHSESDRMVPFAGMREFLGLLGDRYRARGADPRLIEVVTWPETGAPEEHIGFGRHSNDAKNAQTEFLVRWLMEGEGGQESSEPLSG